MMSNNISLLDCTLRDGGLALREYEDVERYQFSSQVTEGIINALKDSHINIIELGSVQNIDKNFEQYAIFNDIRAVSKLIPHDRVDGQLYAAFFQGPDISIENIPEWNSSLCDMIRLSIRYSEIEKSLLYCRELVKKGYKVSVQPIVTMRYADEELKYLTEAVEKMKAFSVYFVDSYGYMNEDDIERIFNIYNSILSKNIKIGFHPHNNMCNALPNTIAFINNRNDRDIIIDSCCAGLGQGAGNLQTEVIANYLNENRNGEYDFRSILVACDNIEKMLEDGMWGYSIPTFISAKYKVAYQYAVALRLKYKFKYSQIADILQEIPKEFQYRFTIENLENLLK